MVLSPLKSISQYYLTKKHGYVSHYSDLKLSLFSQISSLETYIESKLNRKVVASLSIQLKID